MTQTDLAVQLEMAQTQVSNYENGVHEPPPNTVFEIEHLLKVKSGELSRHLGFLPTSKRSGAQQTTIGAILEDDTLTERERDAIINLYKSLSEPRAARSSRGRKTTISA